MSAPVAPLRCVIDSNIFDAIVDEPGMLARVSAATDAGTLALVATSVSRRQLAAISDSTRREMLESVPVEEVGTVGFVVDYSLLDVDRLGPAAPIDAIAKGRTKELEDALIAATAFADGVPLVTEDTRLRSRAARELGGATVWSWPDLRARILAL